MTKKEIDDKYVAIHDALSRRFYQEHSIPEVEFSAQHAKCWQDHEAELVAAGFLTPVPPATDWVAEWKAAADTTSKLRVLAKRLGME